MRILYCTVGMPGAGKSTLLHNLDIDIDPYIISSDAIRQLITGYDYQYVPEESPLGTNGEVQKKLSGKNDHQVWELLYDIVEQRMKHGETVFIDSTMLFKHAFSKINHLRKKYYYRVHLLDLRHQATGSTFDQIVENNQSIVRQHEGKELPKEVLDKYWKREESFGLPKQLNPLSKTEDKDLNEVLVDSFTWRTVQPKRGSRTIVIGDVHGCYTVLSKAMKDLGNPEDNPNDTYVFVGDYLDRGLENDKVFSWLYNRLDLDNIVLLRGNHERHLEHFVQGAKIHNRGFKVNTLPQLERAGFDKEEINRFNRRLQDIYIFKYPGDSQVIVTHAGMPNSILTGTDNNYGLLPESIMVDGIGGFDTDVDALNNSSSSTIKQVHGHRNEFFHEANAMDNTINLEQRVERGGNLAIVVFTNKGVITKLYKNDVYDPKVLEDTDVDLDKMSDGQIKDALKRSHNISVNEVTDGLYANNFTRDAFYEKKWNKLSVTARGLFNDSEGKVVMRGFSKFFELGEREETQLDTMFANHKGKVSLSRKENGFLLLLGLYKGKLKVLTKGGTGNMAKMGMQLVWELSIPLDVQKWLSKHPNKTVLCECVYPGKDSHMVKYESPTLYVLDVVSDEYKEQYFPELVKDFTNEVPGFTAVAKVAKGMFKEDIGDLEKDMTQNSTFLHYLNVEGYVGVLEDGYHFKMKTRWYKTMKEVKHYLDRARSGNTDHMMMVLHLKEVSFHQKDTKKLLLAYDNNHEIDEAPVNAEFDDIDLPRAFPEAYNRAWWEDNILE